MMTPPQTLEAAANGSAERATAKLPRTSTPFCTEEARINLPFEVANCVYLEVTSNEQPFFGFLVRYISKRVIDMRSIHSDMGAASLDVDDIHDFLDDELFCKGKGRGRRLTKKDEVKMPLAAVGLGWHSFTFEPKKSADIEPAAREIEMHVLRQNLGMPTGSNPNPRLLATLVIFVEGADRTPLLQLCQQATEAATQQKENRVSLWRFEPRGGYWTQTARRLARSLDSVVLDEKVKQPLMEDVEWFVREDTRIFYAKHGIPYHRCYLFHGPPGAGKTSFIFALAGHKQRNLCFAQIDKTITDDTFRMAMSKLPSCPMAVLEDVDALFTNHREADAATSSLSFSGFLNSLDGLGAPDDVIICLTTNHPEKLDPAIVRPGRVDMQVAFKPPSADVAAKYFLTFYPGEEKSAAVFGAAAGDRIADRKVSMAQLQHFFLACHRKQLGADDAANAIKDFTFDYSGPAANLSYC